ncbi:MAG TPA: b(o/a)3-type cytochrome-c oxidase subunit 1 [Candidatus Pseudogracilibacillus intestinigallinarum]|uniref:B(O/a)3-type cytochrome-c oxidase subunit 1 n=1 Tax=Candidatus Pseudogracilibacillus intestinigallinarum TaxID=2838742 RepID=A0A9D1TIY7_9BACI|nr:b(o/a)3-type cytochrome-c oxidase subunit 1 [Candidatus Pseudogracilibacillus intestinigallinarum]
MTQGVRSLSKKESRLVMSHMYVAFISLFIGATCGLLQTLERSGHFQLPAGIGYYQILTVHGVILGLVLTTFFILGFMLSAQSKTTGGYNKTERTLAWIAFWLMLAGTIMAATMILLNEATVLFTFYAPLQAHVIFYIGLALVIVGTWFDGFVIFKRHARFRKENPGERTPLLSYMAVITMLMWQIASLGVAITVIFQMIPWALGWTETMNILLSRTLFWYFGHPLVYFWLLPAYMMWYAIVPKIIGGKIFSDSLARFTFILLLLFSIPVGFHHQLTEPGIDPFWKFIQVILTMIVVIPSMMTAFSMFATFEARGRELGAKGMFGWLKKMPWGDARFLAPFIGMLFFIPGGAGGIVNASNQMNQVVHNTIWVTGHFHLTVATTVMLTFFGAAYWLVPSLTGRTYTKSINKLAIAQTILWTVGMTIMSTAMHIQGLLGGPRRSAFSTYAGNEDTAAWGAYQIAQAVGGSILFLGMVVMIIIFINLAFFAPKGEEEYPIAEVSNKAIAPPKVFENWKLWTAVTLALVLFAYTIPLIDIIQSAPPGAKGFKLW